MRPSQQEVNSLVKRYLEGKVTKGDFDSFLTGLDEPEMREIYSGALKSSFEKSLKNNNPYIITSKKEHYIQQLGKYWMGVAATFLLLASFSVLIYQNLETSNMQSSTVYQTAFAEQKNISLPDGTKVNLNVGSSLEQFPFGGQEMRKVNLSGEAFFQVVKDKVHPFEISTQSTKILVLGTAFNVASYDEDKVLEVSVTEGKVNVALKWDGFSVDENLTIGQKIRINKADKTFEVLEFNGPIHWKSRVLDFDQAEFSQVINSLQRWYNVELSVQDSSLYALKLSGQFKDKSIDEVISSIGFLANKELNNKDLIQVMPKQNSN